MRPMLRNPNGGDGGQATGSTTGGGGGGGGGRLLVETSISNTYSGAYTATGGTAFDAGINGNDGTINVTTYIEIKRSTIMNVD